MSLLNPALLFGFALVAVPVVLHLLLRAKPKRLVFPALRLLRQRRIQNTRRLRLRQWWLLLLRMLVIAVFVLALCRPSLPPARYAPTWSEWLRLAVILLLAAAAYFAVMTWWQRQQVPRHALLTRRSLLRGGVGLGTVLLALLVVAWPYQRRVAAEITSPAPNALENVPVAAVFLIDNSLSLSYQHQGKSLLDAARPLIVAQLGQLPAGSHAAVLDASGKLPPVFTPDLTATQNRVDSLTIEPVVQGLNERLRSAIRFQQDERRRTLGEQASVAEARRQDKFVREIYLVTDLAKSAWQPDDSGTLKTELAEAPWLGMYVLDVGVEQPTNLSVVNLRASRESVESQGAMFVEATVRSQGNLREEASVELWLAGPDGRPVKRDQQTVSFVSATEAAVRFPVSGLSGPFVQGEVRLAAADPLAVDDAAYFTVRVLPTLQVLVVAEERPQAEFWLEALRGLNAAGEAYQATFVTSGALLTSELAKFDVVCLINASRPPREAWDKLTAFARAGGGVAVFAGEWSAAAGSGGRRELDPVSYNSPAAQELLPAQLKASLRFDPPQHLYFRESTHALTQRLEALGALAELGDVSFFKYWSVAPQDAVTTLARWTDEATQPALLSREVGQGRCFLFTSSIDSIAWSDWPRNWTYLAFADQLLQLLSRQAVAKGNFRLGEAAVVLLPEKLPTDNLMLRLPDFTQRRVSATAERRELVVSDIVLPGQYQVAVTQGTNASVPAGFSVNLPATETDLQRLSKEELDGLLGPKRYGLARSLQSLSRSVQAGRLGQEVYGLLLACLVAIFAGEQMTAAWFYRTDET